MDDLIIVPAKDQFDLQAGLHRQIRDSLDEVVNTFDIHYNEILSRLDSSQANQIGSYQESGLFGVPVLLQKQEVQEGG